MERQYYLAYGSNLNLAQMYARCPDADLYGVGVIKNYELVFRRSQTGAYLTIEPRVGSEVSVGIFLVSKRDIRSLDAYEGFPNLYYKKAFTVPAKPDGEDGLQKIKGFAYIMDETRPLGEPQKRYLLTCRQGYLDFGFELADIDDAVSRTTGRMNDAD